MMIKPVLFLLLLQVLLIRADDTQYSSTTIPDETSFSTTFQLAQISADTGGVFSISWTIENENTPDERLRLLLKGQDGLDQIWAWMAIGFGKDMRNSQFIVVHHYPNGAVIHEHVGTQSEHGAPPKFKDGDYAVQVESAGFVDNILFAEVTRKTRPNDDKHVLIDTILQDMVWAWSPSSTLNHRGVWFTYHGPNGPIDEPASQTHGAIQVGLLQGTLEARKASSFAMKQLHGFGMMSMYLVLMPMAIFWARYFKSTPNWFLVHMSIQVTSIVGVIVFFIVILMTYQQWNVSHAIVGACLICLTAFQATFGGFTRLGMIRDDVETFLVLKYIHQGNGLLIMVLAAVQVYLGLFLLYPHYDSRGSEFWVLYGCILGFWVLLFGITEVYYYMKINATSFGKNGETTEGLLLKDSKNKIPQDRIEEFKNIHNSKLMMDGGGDSEKVKQFSWDEIDENVRNGKILVVSNGKYVYDASKWIHSHPGGKLILNSVAGTDISLDYFYESGFDASQFVPRKQVPQKKQHRNVVPALQKVDTSRLVPVENTNRYSNETYVQQMVNLTDDEWNTVIKCRRVHVHTRNALSRLSELLVGEISSSLNVNNSQQSIVPYEVSNFSPFEYRRYALVGKTLVTDDGKATAPVYKLKFALLYPYDTRNNQPPKFGAGDAVEIQAFVNGDAVSRYYTPIEGDFGSFSVIVKVKKGGVLTNFLHKQKLGNRQFKIRGPFGGPLLRNTATLNIQPSSQQQQLEHYIPKNLVFIVAGSGITPFLQFLQTMVLPVNEPLQVLAPYQGQSTDELTISFGEYVSVYEHYYDGWAYGVNLMTGSEGVFPLSLCSPPGGLDFHCTLVNCVKTTSDIVGLELIDGALITYPQNMTVHHIVSGTDGDMIRDGVSGYIRQASRLDEGVLGEIVGGVEPVDRFCVISGPAGFNSLIIDTLDGEFEWSASECKVMGESSP